MRRDPKQGRLAFSRVRDWVNGVRFGDILDVWEFAYDGEADLSAADGEVAQARWKQPSGRASPRAWVQPKGARSAPYKSHSSFIASS